MDNLAIAQRNYDSKLPDDLGVLTDLADEANSDWTPSAPLLVTDEEIDSLIEQIADSGMYEDEFGQQKKASELIQAVATDWVDDPMRLPGNTYTAFLKWATAVVKLAKFGK